MQNFFLNLKENPTEIIDENTKNIKRLSTNLTSIIEVNENNEINDNLLKKHCDTDNINNSNNTNKHYNKEISDNNLKYSIQESKLFNKSPDVDIFKKTNKFVYNKIKKVLVVGFTSDEVNKVINYFLKFGKIINIVYASKNTKINSDWLVIEYENYNYSTLAVNNYDELCLENNNSILSCDYLSYEIGKKLKL